MSNWAHVEGYFYCRAYLNLTSVSMKGFTSCRRIQLNLGGAQPTPLP